MIINKAIVSSDDNPLYLDFWNIVSKLWKVKFNIEPILLYFGSNFKNISNDYGTIINMPILKNISISTQTQCARIWYAGQCNDDVVITSDIDMLPLSPVYFVDLIANIDSDKFVNLNPLNNATYFPMCYNIAKSSTFKTILDIENSFELFMDKLIKFSAGKNLVANGMPNWYLDEAYLTTKINEYRCKDNVRIVPIVRRGGQNGYRIDRPTWGYDINLVRQNYYYDAHSVRPYNEYKNTIDNLVIGVLP